MLFRSLIDLLCLEVDIMRRFNSKRSDSWYTGFEHRSQLRGGNIKSLDLCA